MQHHQLEPRLRALADDPGPRWLADAFAAASACAWRWELGTRRLEASREAAAILGSIPRTADELAALVHEDDRAARQLALDRAVDQRGRWVAAFRVRCAGAVRWVEERGTVLLDAAGAPTAVVALVVDVTRHRVEEDALHARLVMESRGRVAAEAATGSAEAALHDLAHSEAFLESMFGSMTDGLVLYGVEGGLTRINPAAREMLGYDTLPAAGSGADALLGHLEVLDVEGRPVPADRLPVVSALRGEIMRGVPLAFQHRDGRKLWATVGAAPIRAPDGAIVGAVLSLGDVTRLRDLQEQREDLSRMIAHDLRAPLGTILGHAKLLGRRAEPTEAVRVRADAIATSAQRMAAMLNDLVESALLEAGKLRLDLGHVDVPDLLRDLRGRLATPYDGERIRVDVAARVPHVMADPNRLERVFVNLFTNALKYSAPQTEVAVRVGTTAEEVVVEVEDHGQGIAPEDLPHLFERYYRAQNSFRFEGMGLGLYTARMLVEAHGGSIEVSTVPGQGSVFRVRLPLRTAQR